MKRLSVLALLLVAACDRATPAAQSWQGQRLDDLVAAWGPPSSVYRMDDGRRVVAWSQRGQGFVYTGGFLIPQPRDCDISYTVDQDGRVTGTNVRGNLVGCNTLVQGRRAG